MTVDLIQAGQISNLSITIMLLIKSSFNYYIKLTMALIINLIYLISILYSCKKRL